MKWDKEKYFWDKGFSAFASLWVILPALAASLGWNVFGVPLDAAGIEPVDNPVIVEERPAPIVIKETCPGVDDVLKRIDALHRH